MLDVESGNLIFELLTSFGCFFGFARFASSDLGSNFLEGVDVCVGEAEEGGIEGDAAALWGEPSVWGFNVGRDGTGEEFVVCHFLVVVVRACGI